MSALVEKVECDYRLVFLLEQRFAERVNDAYLAFSAFNGAPFLDEVVRDLIDFKVELLHELLKHHPRNFGILESDALNAVHYITVEEQAGGDLDEVDYILHEYVPYFCQLFEHDVNNYLIHTQLAFFLRHDFYQPRERSLLINGAIIEVW